MNEPTRFVLILLLAAVALGSFYFVATEKLRPGVEPFNRSLALSKESNDTSDALDLAQTSSADSVQVAIKPNYILRDKYDRIQHGMSYHQVREILQHPGEKISGDEHQEVYRWSIEYAVLRITFRDARVSEKNLADAADLKTPHTSK